MIQFTPLQIADTCRVYGPQLSPLPPGIDGAQLLWGLSGNESSFGSDCAPRHEPAFDVGGAYAENPPMPELLAQYGMAAACSYGPLQLLLCNAPPGTSPTAMADLNIAMQTSMLFLNGLLHRWRPTTLASIGECWNAGRPLSNPGPGVARYVTELAINYAMPMPA
jgi:hypothetical protein